MSVPIFLKTSTVEDRDFQIKQTGVGIERNIFSPEPSFQHASEALLEGQGIWDIIPILHPIFALERHLLMFPDETSIVGHPGHYHPAGVPAWEVGDTMVSPGPNFQTTLEGVEETIASQMSLQNKRPNYVPTSS